MGSRWPLGRPIGEYFLLQPARIEAALDAVQRRGLVNEVPNLFQISLGVLRMGHRLVFRSETVGTSSMDPIRPTMRAHLLFPRAIRFPFLLRERAVAPLDLSGLASAPDRIIRHLLFAHHDQDQFLYDLELLQIYEGALDQLVSEARLVVDGVHPQSAWARDLVVFEGYHERLLTAATAAKMQSRDAPSDDPDISFFAYLRWCAAQPLTAGEAVGEFRKGRYDIEQGRVCPPSELSGAE